MIRTATDSARLPSARAAPRPTDRRLARPFRAPGIRPAGFRLQLAPLALLGLRARPPTSTRTASAPATAGTLARTAESHGRQLIVGVGIEPQREQPLRDARSEPVGAEQRQLQRAQHEPHDERVRGLRNGGRPCQRNKCARDRNDCARDGRLPKPAPGATTRSEPRQAHRGKEHEERARRGAEKRADQREREREWAARPRSCRERDEEQQHVGDRSERECGAGRGGGADCVRDRQSQELHGKCARDGARAGAARHQYRRVRGEIVKDFALGACTNALVCSGHTAWRGRAIRPGTGSLEKEAPSPIACMDDALPGEPQQLAAWELEAVQARRAPGCSPCQPLLRARRESCGAGEPGFTVAANLARNATVAPVACHSSRPSHAWLEPYSLDTPSQRPKSRPVSFGWLYRAFLCPGSTPSSGSRMP